MTSMEGGREEGRMDGERERAKTSQSRLLSPNPRVIQDQPKGYFGAQAHPVTSLEE